VHFALAGRPFFALSDAGAERRKADERLKKRWTIEPGEWDVEDEVDAGTEDGGVLVAIESSPHTSPFHCNGCD